MSLSDEKQSRLASMLTQVFSNEEAADNLDKDVYSLFKKTFSPHFNAIAAKYGITKNNLTLASLRAVMVGMATNISSNNFDSLDSFNNLITDNSSDINLLSSFSSTHRNLIINSEGPFMVAVYLATFKKQWAEGTLANAIPMQHRDLYLQDQDILDSNYRNLLSYSKQIQHGTWIITNTNFSTLARWQDKNQKMALMSDYVINNFATMTIRAATLVHCLNSRGYLDLFEAHPLIDEKGLRAIAFTSYQQAHSLPEIKIIFLGTTDLESGLLDLQPKSPGSRSMQKRDKQLIHATAELAQQLEQQTNKKVMMSILGHSLGGALASHFHARLCVALAARKLDMPTLINLINQSDYSSVEKQTMIKQVESDYERFRENYSALSPLDAISNSSLTTKYGAKGLITDDILATAAICGLQHVLPHYYPTRLILKHTNDPVTTTGERSALIHCQQIERHLLEIDSQSNRWLQRHNSDVFSAGDNKKQPLHIMQNIHVRPNASAIELIQQESKITKIYKALPIVSLVEKGASGILREGYYKLAEHKRPSPMLPSSPVNVSSPKLKTLEPSKNKKEKKQDDSEHLAKKSSQTNFPKK